MEWNSKALLLETSERLLEWRRRRKKNTFLGSGIFLSGFDGTTLIFVSVFGLIFLNRLSLFFFWDPFSLTVKFGSFSFVPTRSISCTDHVSLFFRTFFS